MNLLAPHKFWLVTLILAIALIFGSAPLLGFLRAETAKKLADLRDEQVKTEAALGRLNDDIAATRKLSGQIGASEIEKSLAGVDRLQAVDMLEKQAAFARLDHFTYTVSPEQKWTVSDPALGTQAFALSSVSVKADAPLDTDVYRFVEDVRARMPGRLRLQAITLERAGDRDTPLAAENLHMTADFEWLSNGVPKQMAEGR